jgi:hypothetical protein
MNAKNSLLFLLAVAASWLGAEPAQAMTTYFDSSALTVGVGQTFSLKLYMDANAADDEYVRGYDVAIFYDPAQVRLIDATVGGLWEQVPSNDAPDGVAGLRSPLLDAVVGTQQLLSDIVFQCLSYGVSTINVGVSDVNDGFLLENGSLVNSPPQWTAAGVTVTQVPEAGTLLLMCAGLLGWRKSRA